ncbi:MAG: hypothetical protein EB830_00710 [Nitrosopumilus sp. H13]|nr:MAG: hypothetical protein EB830_00710 [Nitrosopumilus sp. H13]
MARFREITVLSVTALTVAALYVSLTPDNNDEVLEDLLLSATYDDGLATITYRDNSGLTDVVVMEILGMGQTFQETYNSAEFTTVVAFPDTPKYGWAVHPIVLDITHSGYGDVRLKTEIRPAGEPAAPIIVSP